MKTILSKSILVAVFVMALVAMQNATAQAPQKMSYQAVVRSSNNELVVSKTVGMRISILQGSATGTPVYVETQTPATNANGLASVEIGAGNVVSGTVAGINWAAGPYFIKTETDPSGGTNYSIAGASQLLSVPYALFSATGNPGPVGPQGAQGPIGPAGASGGAGPQGVAGPVGATGVQGIQGIAGPIGPAGPQGIQGIAGTPGSSNAWGLTGTTGSNPATNYIGTADDKDIIIKRNNVRAGLIGSLNTSYGVGALNPLSTGDLNTAIGINALVSNTTGTFNVATGGAALAFNTVGLQNTVNGGRAMQNNTTGNNNIAIGFQTMLRNVSGSNATAVGVNAMAYANNTTTPFISYNVAVGFEALRGSTNASLNTGNNNTAIGYQSLLNNTTGINNTANGYLALASNSTGQQNIANGALALTANTTGNYNIAVGYALLANDVGNFNTAIGPALQANISGSNNTAVGYALNSNTIGTFNTAIGDGANVSTGALTNATAIGANAIVNASNKVRIGSTAVTVVEVPVAITVSSDGRLKNDIVDTELGLDFILKIRPVQYTMKQGNGKTDYGFIAQELKTVLGDRSVNMLNKDGEYYTVRYNDLLSPMVKAMQEQQKMIESLKAEVELLKTQHQSVVGKLEMENSLLKSDHNNRLKKLEEMLNVKAQK